MRLMWLTVLAFTLLLPIPSLLAGKVTDTEQSTRLYTKRDPAARGGIHATLVAFANPVKQVFVIDNGNPKLVYQGTVSEDGKEIQFSGLPTAIYELVLVAPDRFYEGCRLSRESDALTDRDRQFITFTINKSVPFFDTKKIHRYEGTTGSNGKARCVLQEMRTHPVMLQSGVERTDIQVRSLKLAILEDVGEAGWQLVMTREILRTEVGPQDMHGLLPHCYLPALGGIRVVDTEKDLGELNLMNGKSASKELTDSFSR